jgi:hypothetical protein
VIDVASAAIARIEYDELSQELIVTFTTGKTYTYFRVPPDVYREFLEAESKGRFFNETIRDRYRYAEH